MPKTLFFFSPLLNFLLFYSPEKYLDNIHGLISYTCMIIGETDLSVLSALFMFLCFQVQVLELH